MEYCVGNSLQLQPSAAAFSSSLQLQRANHRCGSRCSLQSTHQVRSEPEHQRQGVAQGVESADDGRAPGLLHLTAAWDPTDGELRNKHIRLTSDV